MAPALAAIAALLSAIAAPTHVAGLELEFPSDWFPVRIPRVTREDLALPGHEELQRGGAPFILTNALQSSEALTDLTADWVKRKFGSRHADLYEHGIRDTNDKPVITSASDALEFVENSGLAGNGSYAMVRLGATQTAAVRALMRPGYPALFDSDWWLQSCLHSTAARDNVFLAVAWSILIVGSDSAGFHLHWDSINTGTFQFQVAGTKHWVVCDPRGEESFYDPGDIDAFAPDLKAYPAFREALTKHCAHVAVAPGEALFYPSNWWHATKSDGATLGFVGRTVTRWNHKDVHQALRKRCDNPAPRTSKPPPKGAPPALSKEFCSALDTCAELWADRFSVLEERSLERQAASAGTTRRMLDGTVSHPDPECRTAPQDRRDCSAGTHGECIASGCCWGPTRARCSTPGGSGSLDGASDLCPWCFAPA
ncbi:hypothetical protein FNF31_04822 [Cafeteria roenbergensis]|uniref:JmjC domain-containing protein n=1 Tax=Cafeteria roenbergensis TaxID=33653 RepID=A0A5A8D2C4_CAFRO|nr:hypothetical protein FNF31_04822 [Cafeteria roenbergensis]